MRLSIVLCLIICLSNYAQAFSVVDRSPLPNSLLATADEPIQIYFDGMIDLSSVDASTVMVFGRWSGPAELGYEVGGFGNVLVIDPIVDFFAGEYIMVQLSSSVTDLDGNALAHGDTFGYWIGVQPSGLVISDGTHLDVREDGEDLIQSYGAYAGDLDNDGWSDLAVVNETSEDIRIFFSNEGSFSDFTTHELPYGNKPSANEGADFNGDGEIDMVLGNTQGDMVSVVFGLGGGMFGEEIIYDSSQGVRGVAVLDMEGDGDMDIATANRQGNDVRLFMNDGAGNFTPGVVITGPLSAETAITAADMNEDGLTDLIVGGYLSDDISVFINDQGTGFTPLAAVSSGDAPWMIGMGDVNGDGHVDIVAASSGDNSISVHIGDGAGGLSAATAYPTDGFPLAIDLGDLDGDGDLDMVSSNYSGGTYSLYENLGDGLFGNLQTLPSEIAGSCAIFHDRDHDGVMDITGIDELADVLIFFEHTPAGIEELSPSQIRLFPNPTEASFELSFEMLSESSVLLLTDTRGRVVDQKAVPKGTSRITWDFNGPAGEYLILNQKDLRNVATLIKY